MEFREAIDELCDRIGHEDIARALGVSVQAIRQARLATQAKAHRRPPERWQDTAIRLAEKRVRHFRQLIDQLRQDDDKTSIKTELKPSS